MTVSYTHLYTVTYSIKKDASGKAENKLGNTVVSTIKYSKDAHIFLFLVSILEFLLGYKF